MNTGMQDAFNLAWKLALAIHGTCGEALLDTYSPERSGVGDEVLKNTARLTAIGTLRNPIAEELRNHRRPGRARFGAGAARFRRPDVAGFGRLSGKPDEWARTRLASSSARPTHGANRRRAAIWRGQ